MRHAIIGFGANGQALARAFARKNQVSSSLLPYNSNEGCTT